MVKKNTQRWDLGFWISDFGFEESEKQKGFGKSEGKRVFTIWEKQRSKRMGIGACLISLSKS